MCHICLNIENTQFKYYNEGDLRVWWIPQLPMKPFYWKVESPMEAVKLLDILAMYDMFQFEHNIKPDFSNAGGLEIFEDGEWSDWYSEDGLDIDEWNKMSISSTKKAKIKVQQEATLLMEEKLLYVLQETYSVSESYRIARAILNSNISFDELEELMFEVLPDEDYESWEDEGDYA